MCKTKKKGEPLKSGSPLRTNTNINQQDCKMSRRIINYGMITSIGSL